MRHLSIAVAFFLASAVAAYPADFNTVFSEEDAGSPEGGLIAGGLASLYAGYLKYESGQIDIDDPEQGIVGGRLAYSHPLAANLSAQFDILGEVNVTGSSDDEGDPGGDDDLTLGDYVAAVHFDARDPSSYLLGVFGGGGQTFDDGDNGDGDNKPMPFFFVGAEAQAYINNVTLGGQIGYLDSEDHWDETFNNAWFARLTAALYATQNTKLSGEVSYLTGDRDNGEADGDMEVYGWGGRIDHWFANCPVGLMVAYNGFDYRPDEASDESDAPIVHEIRVGATFLFGAGSIFDNDRRAAGADLPPINRWISTAANEIE